MATSSTLNPQIIGQAERALGALMNRVLATTGGTFPQWVALTISNGGDAGIDRERLSTAWRRHWRSTRGRHRKW